MNTSSLQDCPICMDAIDMVKNCSTTECGHCFHTSCLMRNAQLNGTKCPYCRTSIVSNDPEYNMVSTTIGIPSRDFSDDFVTVRDMGRLLSIPDDISEIQWEDLGRTPTPYQPTIVEDE